MARTSFTVDHELGQRIRRVRMILSDRAGHVVHMSEALAILLDLWDTAERDRDIVISAGPADPLTGSCYVQLNRST